MGAAYVALLSDRDELALQLQLYAAAYDPEIRTCVATRFAQLHELCGELSGADPERLRAFIAHGMLCNVAAALDMPQIAWDENWARERLAGSRPHGSSASCSDRAKGGPALDGEPASGPERALHSSHLATGRRGHGPLWSSGG